MAHYEWESEISEGSIINARHTVGDYQFDIELNSATIGMATAITVTITNTQTGETAAATKEIDQGTKVIQWSIDANDTTADVYANIQLVSSP